MSKDEHLGQNLPPIVQQMLNDSPIIDQEFYTIPVTVKEHGELSLLRERWDEMDTDEAMDRMERIIGAARTGVAAKALLEGRRFRFVVDES